MKIDKAFYEQVLKEYDVEDSIGPYYFICAVSPMFCQVWDGEGGETDCILKHAENFLTTRGINDFFIPKDKDTMFMKVLFETDFEKSSNEKREVRLQFLNYMCHEYKWEEDETST